MKVKIGSASSSAFIPSSGVPQGSNLGPLLFVLFFNDVSLVLLNGGKLFYADDLKIYLLVKTYEDCRILQDMLDQIVNWCAVNFLVISVCKCCVISYRRLKMPVIFNYNINGSVLNRVDQMKDLGVLLDHQLTFKLHYSAVLDKANRQLGFMFKVAQDFSDPLCLRSLYFSLVRSILEYASVVWSPYERVWIDRFEAIQRKFLRYALRNLPWNDPVHLPPYEHRCTLLNIQSLVQRRNVGQAVFGAKILKAEIDCPALLGQFQIYAPQRTLRTRQWLQTATRNTLYGANDPLNSICRHFQSFYNAFDFSETTATFKHRITRMSSN